MKDKAYQEKLNVWIDKLAGVEEEKKGVDDVATFEVDAGAEAQANIGILTIPSHTYFVITLIVVYISSFQSLSVKYDCYFKKKSKIVPINNPHLISTCT